MQADSLPTELSGKSLKIILKKIRDTKGTFHAKMGTIKERNGMDLTEAEDIKKRWQEYVEDLHDPDNHAGVITQTFWGAKSSGP